MQLYKYHPISKYQQTKMKQSDLKQNQKMLIEAFKLQNQQAYDQALDKLQHAGDNLIRMIQKIQYNSEFYMKRMPLMKQQRDLVSQNDYKEFMNKNQKILCRNFQKNAYLALLMQEMEQKMNKQEKKKWTNKEQDTIERLIFEGYPIKQIYHKFSRRSKQQVDQKYQQLMQKKDKQQDKNNQSPIINK